MSDIHGCYNQYRQLLDKIRFTDDDTLYVLGDVVDRGEQPMKVLLDMSMRANVIPIVGNHEYFAINILGKLGTEITEGNLSQLGDIIEDVNNWQEYGGGTTLRDYGKLTKDERAAIYDYLTEFSLYEMVTVNGKTYVLTHAGLPPNATLGNLYRFDLYDFVTASVDYRKIYFQNVTLVTGHTPTFKISKEHHGKVYRGNNHLAIDAGGIFGGAFACVCLDTGEAFYVT